MEKRVKSIVFRRMTYADFRHINKVGGEEQGGGGQSYIDFPVAEIALQRWVDFLGNHTDLGAGDRPIWNFSINSLGVENPITLKIYQRRPASVSISSQKLHTKTSNRIPSWHPDNGFPTQYDPEQENLVVYIIKTTDGQYWAGWFLQNQVSANLIGSTALSRMFTQESAGYIEFRRKLFIETSNRNWPFYFNAQFNDVPTELDVETELELEDTSPRLQTLIESNAQPQVVARIMRIRQRNNSLVRNLKNLYNGQCQLTGEKLTFRKRDGQFYSEVHHLIPLGDDGSDSYENAIVVSPLIHRMLHYATVSDINLAAIVNGKLPITINGANYEITWHPEHSTIVQETLQI